MVNARKYESWINNPTNIFTQAALQLWNKSNVTELEDYILNELAWNPESDPSHLGFSGKNAGCPMITKETNEKHTPSKELYEQLLPDYLSFVYR